MSKELPYFRFTVSEWMNDDISAENYKNKGIFIDVCSYYWFKDCHISLAMLKRKFSNAINGINQLIESEIIKVNDSQEVTILFLDEQYDILSEKRKNRQKAGKLGGLQKSSNAKAMLKQKPSYKDNNKDKDNITPSFPDFLNYAKSISIYHSSFDFQIETKYEAWKSNNWKDGYNKPIKNWKNKLKSSMIHFKKDFTTNKPLKII